MTTKTKTIGFAAILALTSTAAFAGSFQFSVNGGTARIQFDENCSDRLCASVSWQDRGSRERTEFKLPEVSTKTISKYIDTPAPKWNSDPDVNSDTSTNTDNSVNQNAPTTANDAPAAAPDPAAQAAPQAAIPSAPVSAPVASAPAPVAQPSVAPVPAPVAAAPTPAPVAAAPASVAPAPAPVQPAPVVAQTPPARVAAVAPEPVAKPSKPTPVGEWLVEDGEGKIRIEECGANLCGYVSAAKNPNEKDRNNPDPSMRNRPVIGTQILQSMKPNGGRWSGRIYNVKDGKTYTANISLKSANTLRVEGCAFGGLICGGQNWSRVN